MGNGVTIGIPVFNEELRIERAVRCAAPQCDRLIVADNASSDGTQAVCRRLQREFPNMDYVRHGYNMGALENWHFILEATETPFFMTLGSHDYIDGDFIETLLRVLVSDDSVVLAAGGLSPQNEMNSHEVSVFNAWQAGLQEDAADRVRSLLFDRAHLAWAIYGLFRTEAYKACFTRDLPPYGIDVVFLAKIAMRGKIAILADAQYHAWTRNKGDETSGYVERILGRKENSGNQLTMRNTLRVALFDILSTAEAPSGILSALALRFQTMVRFGTFKRTGGDIPYYALYLPVKIVRKFDRLSRAVNR